MIPTLNRNVNTTLNTKMNSVIIKKNLSALKIAISLFVNT